MYDYEFTETRIFNTLSHRVLIPDAIDEDVLDRIGLSSSKRQRYPGLKEELYIRHYLPDPDFDAKLAAAIGRPFPKERVLVVLRPPASTANYHDPRSDSIFAALLLHLSGKAGTFTVVVPRTKDQASEIEGRLAGIEDANDKFAVLHTAVDGLDLINIADVVISGGGTMNREAVLLGVPVYSIFQGEQGSLDRKMERSGDIVFLRHAEDLAKVKLEKRAPGSRPILSDRVEQFVKNQIDFIVAKRSQR